MGGRDPLEMSDIVVPSSRVFKTRRSGSVQIQYSAGLPRPIYRSRVTRHFLYKQSNSKFAGMVYLAPTHVLNSRLITPIKSVTAQQHSFEHDLDLKWPSLLAAHKCLSCIQLLRRFVSVYNDDPLYFWLPWFCHLVASVTAVAYDWGERTCTWWIINVLTAFNSTYIRTRGSVIIAAVISWIIIYSLNCCGWAAPNIRRTIYDVTLDPAEATLVPYDCPVLLCTWYSLCAVNNTNLLSLQVRFIGILYSVYVNLTKTKLILIPMISLNIACMSSRLYYPPLFRPSACSKYPITFIDRYGQYSVVIHGHPINARTLT